MRRGFPAAAGLGFVALLAIAGEEAAIHPRQRPPKPDSRSTTLRVETSLVLVPVTVTDPLNRPVRGLDRENFRVFDNKVEQPITRFAMDDEPLAVGFVFDTSGSMGDSLHRTRLATAEFFANAEPGDEFCLVEFDSTARLSVPLTQDGGKIQEELLFTRSAGSTALLDGVNLAVRALKKSQKTKKALVLLSDGGENHSRYTFGEIKNFLRESDVLIYSIGPPADVGGGALLKSLSEETGGRLVVWNDDLPELARKIIRDLRNRYVLGYSPHDQPKDGKYHSIQVRVLPPAGLPKVHAHWRRGYYAGVD